MRFALEKTADIMYNNVSFSSLILSALLDKTKDICIAAGQSGVQHPALYLIKIIVRLHGLSSFKAIAKVYPWVIPASMKTEQVWIQITSFIYTLIKICFYFLTQFS